MFNKLKIEISTSQLGKISLKMQMFWGFEPKLRFLGQTTSEFRHAEHNIHTFSTYNNIVMFLFDKCLQLLKIMVSFDPVATHDILSEFRCRIVFQNASGLLDQMVSCFSARRKIHCNFFFYIVKPHRTNKNS